MSGLRDRDKTFELGRILVNAMGQKIVLRGLQISDFIHPKELAARDSLVNTPAGKKLVKTFGDLNLKLYKTITEGTYVQLKPQTAPSLFRILRNVCAILDYREMIPEVYVYHSMSHMVRPCSADSIYIVMADYVLQTYDEDMLYYILGNAIAMILAGHVEMTTAASYMGSSKLLLLPQLEFKKYLHLADITSDRGGLLACQSFAAAIRCHLFELGYPPSESRKLFTTDEEAVLFVRRYLKEAEAGSKKNNLVTDLAAKWIKANYIEAPGEEMMKELLEWYIREYPALLQKYR